MARIESKDDLERWLQDKPLTWSVAIATRAALRVFPLIGDGFARDIPSLFEIAKFSEYDVVLLFRAIASSFVAILCEGREVSGNYLIDAAASADRIAGNRGTDAAKSVSFAAFAAADAVSDASAENASDIIAFAVDAATAAVAALSGRVATQFHDEANISIWAMIELDAQRLELNGDPQDLIHRRLWYSLRRRAEVDLLRDCWRRFSRQLRFTDHGWKIWTDWYDDRIAGRRPRFEELELFRMTLTGENDWNKGPDYVNDLIAEKLAGLELLASEAALTPAEVPSPPPPKAASLEPKVVRGKVAVPPTAAETSFDAAMMGALLGKLSEEVAVLGTDMRAEPQYDQHAVAHLERVAVKLAVGHPTHADLFAVCLEYETLKDFRQRVAAEWPDVFVSRYRAIVSTMKSAVDKFPPWREFKKEHPDDADELTAEQMEVLRAAAAATVDELRSPEHEAFVDPSTPDAVEKLADEFAAAVAEMTATADPLPLRMALRAKDFVESLANTAKRFAELGVSKAVEAGMPVGGFVKRVGGKMVDGFTSELEKSLEKLAKDAGKKAPVAIWRFMKRAFAGGVAGTSLAVAFPDQFGWLPAFLAAMACAGPVVLPKRKKKAETTSADD